MAVTILKDKIYADDSHYVEGVCLSTDTKPSSVCNGSKMFEMDTNKTYYYNAAGTEWIDPTEEPEVEGGE